MEGDATVISFPLTLGKFLAYVLPDQTIYAKRTQVSSKLALKKLKQHDCAVVA